VFTVPSFVRVQDEAFVVDQESVVFPGAVKYEGDAVNELIWKLFTTTVSTCTFTVRESDPPFVPIQLRVKD